MSGLCSDSFIVPHGARDISTGELFGKIWIKVWYVHITLTESNFDLFHIYEDLIPIIMNYVNYINYIFFCAALMKETRVYGVTI